MSWLETKIVSISSLVSGPLWEVRHWLVLQVAINLVLDFAFLFCDFSLSGGLGVWWQDVFH